MFLAKLAILLHFDSVWSILFVFVCPVISVLTFRAGQSDVYAHGFFSSLKIKPLAKGIAFFNGGGRET